MPRNSSAVAVAVAAAAPWGRGLGGATAKLPRMGICYSRNVRLVLGVMKMVWIYLNVGFEGESSRKKFGSCFWRSEQR